MAKVGALARKQVIADLNNAVACAAEFLAEADAGLHDENQTARQVLSHIVFWHQEYGRIAKALAYRHRLCLKAGTIRDMNARATEMFAPKALPALARQLTRINGQLIRILVRIPDWRIDFPLLRDLQTNALP